MLNERNNKIKTIINLVNISLFAVIVFFMFSGTSKVITIANRNFSISFWVSLIAIPLFVLSYFFVYKTKVMNRIAIILFCAFGLLSFTSITMSLMLTPHFSGYGGEYPIIVVLEESIKYLYDITLLLYFIFFIRFFSKKHLTIFAYSIIALWVVVSVIQFVIYLKPTSIIATIYDKADFLDILVDSSLIDKARYEGFRLYSFLSEPSVNCIFICGFVLPFLIFQTNKTKKKPILLAINIILLLIVAAGTLLTKSSAVYVTVFAFLIASLVFVIDKAKLKKVPKIIISCSIVAIFAMLFVIPFTRQLILYYAVDKIISISNLSTAYRYSTVFNDLLVFIKMPLFGCGDGNQGFFYFQHIAGTQMTISYETVNSLSFKQGILNGGALIPSFISGFGLFGIVVIFVLVKCYLALCKEQSLFNNSLFKYLFYTSFISISVAAMVAIGIHWNFTLYFFFSVPFIKPDSSSSIKDLLEPISSKRIINPRHYQITI